MTKRETCPLCKRRFVLDGGYFPTHPDSDGSGDECPASDLPPHAASLEASERRAENWNLFVEGWDAARLRKSSCECPYLEGRSRDDWMLGFKLYNDIARRSF